MFPGCSIIRSPRFLFFLINFRGVAGMPSPVVLIISVCFLRDSADYCYVSSDVADSPAVLAPRVKGSLYPFRWVARWHPSAPI